MNQEQLKNIVEAALMVSDAPLSILNLIALFDKETEQPEKSDIRAALAELQLDFAERGLELKEIASGFRFQVKTEYAPWVNRLYEEKPQRYSRALLETLAIIAYRQPITRGEIENIRGVSVSSTIIKTLQEREWIRVVGHRDVPGKPELLATTKLFLDYFNLKKLADLPSLTEIKDFDQINPDLFDAVEIGKQGSQEGNTSEAEESVLGEELDVEEASNLEETEVSDTVDDEHSGNEEIVASEIDAKEASEVEEPEDSDTGTAEPDESTETEESEEGNEIDLDNEISEDDKAVPFSS